MGEIAVAAQYRDGASRLRNLRQAGCAKALTPRHDGDECLAVTINTAGGLTGGDRLDISGEADAGARLAMTTQAAERAYRAQPGEIAEVSVRLSADSGGRIGWLPQETILFDGCALRRRIEVDLAPDATLLAVEACVLGRAAMGEVVTEGIFEDQWRVRRDGALVYADALRLSGDIRRTVENPAALGGAGAFASICLIGPQSTVDPLLAPARKAIGETGGASQPRPGVLAARLVARNGFELRRALIPVLGVLRERPLPAVWTY